MAQPQIYEGTLEEIAEQLRSTELTGRFKVIVVPEEEEPLKQNGTSTAHDARSRPSILGKYAGHISSSEEFIAEKHREIAREDGIEGS